MAFPQVASVTVTQFGSNTTSHNVNHPATVNSGDLLIYVISSDDNTNQQTPGTVTAISGPTNSPSSSEFGVYGRVADGTEGGTSVDFTTFTSQSMVAHVFRITAWGGTLGTDVVVGTPATGTSTTPNPPSLTSGFGAVDTLWIACFGGNNDNTVSAFPTNYSSNQNSHNSGIGAGGCTIASCTREYASASDDPATFTWSESTGWVAQTIAVKPSAGSAVSPLPLLSHSNGGFL